MPTSTTRSAAAANDSESRAAAIRRARNLVLVGAFASFLFSVTLWFTGSREEGLFVGLWVPSILGLGNLMLSTSE